MDVLCRSKMAEVLVLSFLFFSIFCLVVEG